MTGARTFAIGLLLLTATTAFGGVTRGPYIQDVHQDTAVVGLRLDSPCPVRIRYGGAGALDAIANSSEAVTQHYVELDGLEPGKEYHFTVEACDTPTGASGSFQTASAPNAPRVHFAALGDMGNGDAEPRAVGEAIAASRPEFWLSLGDDANFLEPLTTLLRVSPVFAIPGNDPARAERSYSFDWGPLHVVALDSKTSLEEQRTWLEADLAASKAPWKMVMSQKSFAELRRLGPTFERHGVDLVLSGHDHDYERSKPLVAEQPVAPGTSGAVTYIVVGSGGAALRDSGADEAHWIEFRENMSQGYLEMQIDGGTLVAQFVTPTGEIVDTFTKEKEVPAAPELSMGVEPAAGTAPLPSHFKLSGNDGAMVAWTFGDGGNRLGTAAEVTHTYRQPGVYTATAVVEDILGETYYATTRVTVLDAEGNPGPVVDPPPPAKPPEEPFMQDIGCSAASAGLLGLPLALVLLALNRTRP